MSADLQIYQGNDFSATVTVSSPNTPPATVIQGYTAAAQIRQDIADVASTIILALTTAVASPNITLSATHTQTAALPHNTMRWDLQVTSPSGIVTTILAGLVIVYPQVTR